MIKIMHRINTVEGLKKTPKKFGVEVDVRTRDNSLILHHDPFQSGDFLDEYLNEFDHAFIILEIKEEGIEKKVINLCKLHGLDNYFLLSVSFPSMYILSKNGMTKMAVRCSEFEDINTALAMKGKIEWVWVDTFESLPLNKQKYDLLNKAGYKICLVCPERWGRPKDIEKYKLYLDSKGIEVDAVMTSQNYENRW